MRLLLLFLMIPTVTGAQLRGQSEKVTTFGGSLELVTTKTAYAVMTFGVMYRERRIVMPAKLLYRGDLMYQITLISHKNTTRALHLLSQSNDKSYELILEGETLYISSIDTNLILNLSLLVRLKQL